MANKPNNSRELRQLAESVVAELKNDPLLIGFNPDGIATSLVRQWLTYEGSAALQLATGLFFLGLDRTPLGTLTTKIVPCDSMWLDILVNQWKVNPDDLPAKIHDINLKQSTDILTLTGKNIRWWVDPKLQKSAIDDYSPEAQAPPTHEVLLRIANDNLRNTFAGSISEKEYFILSQSIVRQWQRFAGNASIFTESKGVVIKIIPDKDGGWSVLKSDDIPGTRANLEQNFIPPDEVTDALISINLGLTYTYLGTDGNRHTIWSDPSRLAFGRKTLSTSKENKGLPPIVCPACGGILDIWRPEATTQHCPLCRLEIKR